MHNSEVHVAAKSQNEETGTHLCLDTYQDCWTEEKEKVIREPFDYLLSHPGNDFISTILTALDSWLNVPPHRLEPIKHVSTMLHNAALLVDDVQDGSERQRGFSSAHHI